MASRFSAEERAQGFSNTTLLARPRNAGDDATIEAAEIKEGLTIRDRFARFGNLRVLRIGTGETVQQAVTRLRATGRYAYVEPDRIIHSYVQPNDTSFAQQWSFNNTGQNGGTINADIRALTGWDTNHDATSVIVAVVDSGIRLTHSDLQSNLWTKTGTLNVHGIRATEGNGTTTTNPDDDTGHGTHVAGVIGATGNNSGGVAGVAWTTKMMALKFITTDGSGSTADSIACINYAIANGASVINASWGSDGYSSAEFDAIKGARDAGVIFVAAAGNDGLLNDTNEDYPSNYGLDNIITVAATTRTDTLATFSNYGSGLVDLGAPGQEIYSTYNSSDSSYATLSGTSMAAPHVTGAVALLKATYPTEGYRQIINRLLRGTSKLSALSGKVQTGGRLNLAQALSASSNSRPFNDDFAERAVVSGPNVRIRSNNQGATSQLGENNHAGVTGATTLWWTWTAPADSQVAFDTNGSAYDTALAVYTGSSVGSLTAVGSNDNASTGTTTSRVLLNVVNGTTYQIAVTGKNSAYGYTALRIGTVPANDNLANAIPLTGSSVKTNATVLNATKESGEKNPTGNAAGNSVWYKWVAPKSGNFVLSAFATSTDTIAAVYTGSGGVGSLNLVGAQDNSPTNASNSDAYATFNATSGTTYYFSIDHASDGTDGGDFILTLTEAAWEFAALDEITSSPAVGSDGTIYFGAGSDESHDNAVYAVTSSGAKKWSAATSGTGVIGGSPAIASDGTVYVAASDKILYAFNGSSGARKWSYTAATALYSTPAIGADGTVYFRDDSKLYALSSAGSLKWSFDLTGSTDGTYSSPAVTGDGTIYVGTNGGNFYAVKDNGSSASQKWKYAADGDIYTSAAIATDGTVYFATLNGTVYALTDGGNAATKKWSWTAPANSSITSSLAVGADGAVYFAAYDHKLYALNSSGAQKWACTLGDEVRASSPAVASDGTIYIGCYDGLIYAVSSSGTVQTTYSTAKQIRSSPAISGNRLYIGSADSKLYAIDIGNSAATSSWPMFHANAARTGRFSAGALTISSQPQSKSVIAGSSLSLSVSATGSGTLTYQWYKNNVAIPGATGATYTVAVVTAADAGNYTVKITTGSESITSAAATVTVLPFGTVTSSFANIATRAYCSTDNRVTIGGFVVSGPNAKRVLIRAVGPSLTSQGLGAAEVLADPTIDVYKGATVINSNDNWGDNTNAAEITATAAQIGAASLTTSDTKSAALLITLQPGVYSFVVNGKGGTSGVVLLEVYDADGGVTTKFVNIATRAYATTGNGVAIGGFVISGNVAKNVLIRAVGPTLSTQGIGTAELLADPVIELHQGAPVIASNDNWTTNANVAEIRSTGTRIGATPLAESDTTSSALLLSLQPGVYSFIASGKSSSSGIVLVEIYDAD